MTLRPGSTPETRNTRPGPCHAACSRGASQNRSRESAKVAPNARFDCNPSTTRTGAVRRSSSEPVFSSGPSWTTTSSGVAARTSASTTVAAERVRANVVMPSAATGRNATIVASATATPNPGARRQTATTIPSVPSRKTSVHRPSTDA